MHMVRQKIRTVLRTPCRERMFGDLLIRQRWIVAM
jgi:hypothetical protein